MEALLHQLKTYASGLYLPKIHPIDIVEILIIAVLLYYCISWIRSTRAYTLLKGILFVGIFILIADLFQMTTVLWIARNLATVAVTAVIIIFQPELRKALEQLGQKNLLSRMMPFDTGRDEGLFFSDKTITELVRATFDMSEVKTGALIVMEQNILLTEYENTGIPVDGIVTSQLLVNIFEHNTPLHDGAIVVRGDRVVSATCYLPLSDSLSVSKELGTRHRAGLGISEVSDSFTIIVSEETGRVSFAQGGRLTTGVTPSELREQLHKIQKRANWTDGNTRKFRIWKGRDKHEEASNE